MYKTLMLGGLLLLTASLSAETRYHQYTAKYKNPKNPATPEAAGYLGGSGDETLSGAAILPDGRVLLAGTCWGSDFDLKGVDVRVIGKDGAKPAFTMPTTTKKGKTRNAPPDWSYVAGAGFVVELSEDYGSITKAVRFPWGSGSLTDIAADSKGGIYVTGICGVDFAKLTKGTDADTGAVTGTDDIYFGKLNASLDGFDWCKVIKDNKQAAPRLTILEDGSISLIGQNAYHFQSDGSVAKATAMGMTGNWVRGVDPVSHAQATGGDRNTNTGYEPWRQPVLHVRNDQNQTTDVFYEWSPKIVGTNWSRLVSDSDIRVLNYDKDGKLMIVGWSDGGNSVLEYLPYDMKRNVYGVVKERTGRNCGLGFSTWGAGVGSFCHIIKLDPASGEPVAKTMFIAYLGGENKPNGLNLNWIDSAADNSVLMGGGSAWGLIETGSLKLNSMDPATDYMGGPFIAVLNGDMSDIRFSSAIPGAGQAPIVAHSTKAQGKFASRSAEAGSKVISVFVSGAVKDPKFTPKNNAQKAFGGGNLDGLYVVLRMDKDQPKDPASDSEVSAADDKKSKKKKQKKAPAVPSGSFKISEGMSKPWSVLVMRDKSGKQWPAFYLCGPKGEGSVDTSGKGSFTILGDAHQVELGGGTRQDVRLGGSLSEVETYKDKKGRERSRRLFPTLELKISLSSPTQCKATITFNGNKKTTASGNCSIRESKPTGKGSIMIGGSFSTTKGDLGLADGADAKDEVVIEFWVPGRK